jgi:hypothetical protein
MHSCSLSEGEIGRHQHRTLGSKRRVKISGNRLEDQYTVALSCRMQSAQGIAPFLRWGVTGGDLIFNEVAPHELPVELIHLVSLLRRNVRKAESFQLIVAGLEIVPIEYGVHGQRMMRARVSKGNVAEQSPDEKQAEHPADQFHNEVTRHAMCGPIGGDGPSLVPGSVERQPFGPCSTDRLAPNLFAELSEKLRGASEYRP